MPQVQVANERTKSAKRQNKNTVLKTLLDTGTTVSIVSERRIDHGTKTTSRTEWNAAAGEFITTDESSPSVKPPELSSSDTVNCDFKVHNGKPCHCDMTMRRNLKFKNWI